MKTKAEVIYMPDLSTKYRQSLFEAVVSAGFPSPAADYEEDKLDLNRYLIKNPAATFFVRVTGYSMMGAGIYSGDLLVVDRSLEPRDKSVVIAVIDGELTVKRIRIGKKKITLEPENENYSVQQITEDTDFQVWGVVTNVIHAL
ncbi:MAG TPA: translesion error-prone DNA polymerase V autoproteolytic subunit [Sedimentisphaerales bacterium]|nr:translesion error-prone DNA polymerase V autoproteolytic subunit [Sedimentisphaerales bacterium]